MLSYTIVKQDTPDWSKVPAVSLTHTGWLPPCAIGATAQLCHNGTDLFVRMEASEQSIRATLQNPLDSVCEDSCLEFFFAPAEDDSRYFNFEFNPLGNFYIGFGGARDTRCRLLPLDTEQFEIHPYRTEAGWGITYRIPGSFLRMYFPSFTLSGNSACNFYKCGDCTEVPHYLSWAPMSCENPDYHRRADFACLHFE